MALSVKSLTASTVVGARRSVVVKSAQKYYPPGYKMVLEPNWYPGMEKPAHLKSADIPGNYGFDPLNLGADSDALEKFRQAEVYHCRWAMLGVVGCLVPEILGYGNWVEAQSWPLAGAAPTYFGITPPHALDLKVVIGCMLGLFAMERAMFEYGPADRKIYPGYFDVLKMTSDRTKQSEIVNGRLAMVACAGLLGQYYATGKGPMAALSEHLAAPLSANFATNGVSVPFF